MAQLCSSSTLCWAQGNGIFHSVRDLTGLNSGANEFGCRVSPDGLELYFNSDRTGDSDLWVAERATVADEFGEPRRLDEPLNSPAIEGAPCLSSDGLELYFGSTRPGTGGFDLYVARREKRSEPFTELFPLAVNSTADDSSPSISADGLTLYFLSDRTGSLGGYDIFVTHRASRDDKFAVVEHLSSPINSTQNEWAPFIAPDTADGSALLLGRGDPADLWMAPRREGELAFSSPLAMGSEVNSLASEYAASVAGDWPASGAKLYFISCRGASCDIWEATWTIVVDDLRCMPSGCGSIHLEWSNPGALEFERVRVLRDGRTIATLDGAVRDFTDTDAAIGQHVYTVDVGYMSQTATVQCAVDVECTATRFRRGDSNADGTLDISDAVFTLLHLFRGGDEPPCLKAADHDNNGEVEITDAVGILDFLFKGDAAPPQPFPDCGWDPDIDELTCLSYPPCSTGP